MRSAPPPTETTGDERAKAGRTLARAVALHALVWLAATAAAGVLLAALLVSPLAGRFVEPLTYGRWAPLHLDLGLYGALAVPLVGLLFVACGVERAPLGGRLALACWSGALGAGAASWLGGRTSGKLFVDWSGQSERLFLGALALLWIVLAVCFSRNELERWRSGAGERGRFALGALGLLLLAAVPVALALGASRRSYPPIDPASGGPTGASLLGSTLGLVALLLLLPRLARLPAERRAGAWVAPALLGLHALAFLALGGRDAGNELPSEQLAVASTVIWAVLVPHELARFRWPSGSRRWLAALAGWGGVVVATGIAQFFPDALASVKFTHALVAHAHAAMAGFGGALALLSLHLPLVAAGDSPLDASRPFWLWQAGGAAQFLVLAALGGIEAADPAALLRGGPLVESLLILRLLCGCAMLAAALGWLDRLTPALALVPPLAEPAR